MKRYSLHAIGSDRTGIVAAVTRVLADIGCNLEDSRMTILHGQFAIMLIVEAPEGLSSTALEASFGDVCRDFDLLVGVRLLPDQSTRVEVGDVVMISVHGADHPGIVADVTNRVARLGGNIIDLATRKIDEGALASYVLLVSVAMPSTLSEGTLRAELEEAASELGVICVVSAGSAELF